MSMDFIAAVARAAALQSVQAEKQAAGGFGPAGILGSMVQAVGKHGFTRPVAGAAAGMRHFAPGRAAATLAGGAAGAGLLGSLATSNPDMAGGNLAWQGQRASGPLLGGGSWGDMGRAWANPMHWGSNIAGIGARLAGKTPEELPTGISQGAWQHGADGQMTRTQSTTGMQSSPERQYAKDQLEYWRQRNGSSGGGGHGGPSAGPAATPGSPAGPNVPDDPAATHSFYVNYGRQKNLGF